MADITVHRNHSYGKTDARARLERLLKAFQASKPDLIQTIDWQGDGATAGGKYFKGQFRVTDTALDVDLDLLGFAAKAFKGTVREKLERAIGEEFPA